MNQYHIFISGRVQGVFFRANTCRKARELGVKGWVRNVSDGRVEVVAQGEKIKEFIEFLKQGPLNAKVENVEIIKEPAEEMYENFEINY